MFNHFGRLFTFDFGYPNSLFVCVDVKPEHPWYSKVPGGAIPVVCDRRHPFTGVLLVAGVVLIPLAYAIFIRGEHYAKVHGLLKRSG
jgi:hypothetical protein